MNSIFFDLETTDLNTIGQILNYSFVEVDGNWNIKSKLSGKIKISRLQLPDPFSIIHTKTDIIEHNDTATDSEPVAMAKIQKYISGIVEWKETRLIGFNSNKFDIPFLRTSMIRNGINPYFNRSLKYGDVTHVLKRLLCDNKDFASKLQKYESGKHKLTLESTTQALGILDKDKSQEHESMFDVMLTINLARHLHENYGLDVRSYNSYEVDSRKKFDAIKIFPYVNLDNSETPDEYCYYAPLSQTKTQTLWINLKKFEDGLGKDSIFWYNKNTSSLFVKEYIKDAHINKRTQSAIQGLSHITLDNFFEPKDCDIEQFIFAMPVNHVNSLYDAIWRKDLFLLKEIECKHASKLYLRFLCNNQPIEKVQSMIKQYAVYRYGGKIKMDSIEKRHKTYSELLSEIDMYSKNPEYLHLMTQLKRFYEESPITQFAKNELLEIPRREIYA